MSAPDCAGRNGAHTPGPWHVDFSDDRFIVRDANDDVVADCWNGTITDEGEVPLDTCEPNARLIAAAPDALAVCRGVVAWWNEHQYDVDRYDYGDGYVDEMNVYDDEPEFVTLAKAVIAKAEGRTDA